MMDRSEANTFIASMPDRFRTSVKQWDILRTMLERNAVLKKTHERLEEELDDERERRREDGVQEEYNKQQEQDED